MTNLYSAYQVRMQKIQDINSAIALMSWDQEIFLPKNGVDKRSRQISTLSGMAHELFIDKDFGVLLANLSNGSSKDLNPQENKNIEITYKEFKKQTKFSTSFIKQRAKIVSSAFYAWKSAHEANDFSLYKDHLAKIVEIKREEAELIGYEGHPYNALLDSYEPGAKVEELDELFKAVSKELVGLVKEINAKPQVDSSFLFKKYDKDKQWEFGLDLLKQMGYDFDAGRQDVSPHPFTINFAATDVRVTTRIDEKDFGNMTWSCIHEGGHALYEQGLLDENYGLPLGQAISLGIHESQSRLWENNVGRGIDYWKANYSKVQELFPENLKEVSLESFYKAINRIAPNEIRTEADELHYHFHVLIRYEIEKGLIDGSLEVDGLDEVWNKKYKEYLGIEVSSARTGILQDIHWSHGSIGYFATYSLGSFYAAQFFAQAEKEIEGLNKEIEKGNMLPLLDWLREKVHKHGRFYTASELCKEITGEKLNLKYFMDYARKKYSFIYDV